MKNIKTKRLPLTPSDNALKVIEQSGHLLLPNNEKYADWHIKYVRAQKKRLAIDLEMVCNNFTQDNSILEVGAAPFILTKSLEDKNFNVTGIDIAPERYKDSLSKISTNIYKCDIEKQKLPFEDNTFHLILFNELFEHLRINPIFTLSEVYRVLEPNGTLLLSTPNLKSIVGLTNYILKGKAYSCSAKPYNEYKKLETIGHMGHVREYTTTEVVTFLQKIGFVVTTKYFRGRYFGWKGGVIKIFPSLSPFVTYEAKKLSR